MAVCGIKKQGFQKRHRSLLILSSCSRTEGFITIPFFQLSIIQQKAATSPQKRKVGLNGKLCKEECVVVGADAQQLPCKVSVGGLNCCHTWSFIQR